MGNVLALKVERLICSHCGHERVASEFGRDPRLHTGLRSKCNECVNTTRRAARAARGEPPPGTMLAKVDDLHPDLVGRLRTCKACAAVKPLTAFPRNSHSLFGRLHRCEPCQAEYHQVRNLKLRNARLEKYRFRAYGVSLSEIQAAFDKQGGKCAICTLQLADDLKKSHVDHDHVTGKFRGILCANCNWGLGNFRDDVAALEAAAAYLREKR